MTGLLAVAFGPRTMREALDALPRIAAAADAVELRLDLFAEPFDLPTLLHARGGCPTIVTYRPRDQGGQSDAPSSERLDTLCWAVTLGAECVDLEWDAATPAVLAALRSAGNVRVIISRHDLAGMPPDLADTWWPHLAAREADIVKVVGTARQAQDCLPVFQALRQATAPTIALAMGAAGLPTRVLALREPACFLTFASLDPTTATAPGQVTLDEMRQVYRAHQVGPATAAYGVLSADPDVPANHDAVVTLNAHLAAHNRDAVAVPILAGPDPLAVVHAYHRLPLAGWYVPDEALQATLASSFTPAAANSLTLSPAAADTITLALTPAARRAGRVNTLHPDPTGHLTGDYLPSPTALPEAWSSP